MIWSTLGVECEVVGGGTPSRSRREFFGGSVPWATPTDVTALTSSRSLVKTKETITEEGLRRSSAKLLPAGTVLLTSRATIGFTAVAAVPLATNQGFANLICGPRLLPEFLAVWLPTQRDQLLKLAGGTTFKEISKSTLKGVRVPVPPLDDQRRIVDLLSRAAGLKLLAEQAQVKARELIPALFVDMFGDPATNPKGWPVTSIGGVASYTRYGPRFPDRAYTSSEGAHILRTTDIAFDGTVAWERCPVLAVTQKEIEKYALKPGTILITRTGATIGKTALFRGASKPCIAGAYLIEIGIAPHAVPEYVLHLLLSAYGQAKLNLGTRAVAQPNVNVPTICSISLPLPPFELQAAFRTRVEEVANAGNLAKAAAVAAEQTSAALMSRLFAA